MPRLSADRPKCQACGCWDHSAYHLEFLPAADLSPNTTHFTAVDPNRIDTGPLQQWSAYCGERHALCCPLPSQTAVKDIILIDTQRHCLVQFPVAPRYTALSYVWGFLPDPLETIIANFPTLQLPKALLDPEIWGRLPRTIRDAIRVTKDMGERYLWVDRLCIVQDDASNKAQQIASMASIYGNSVFTIVAADGANADSGLQGVGVPRSFPVPPTLELDADCHVRPAPETEEASKFAAWHHRGWTFQERLLTTRALIFFRGTVIWQCKTSIWAEGVAAEPNGIPFDETWRKERKRPAYQAFDRRFMFQLESPSRPHFPHYEDLVRQYARRKLAYQADGLRAFAGIMDVLSTKYEGGFLHGQPEMFFDVAMLWAPLHGAKPRIVAPESEALIFPSWTWAAWEGRVANDLSDHIAGNSPSLELYPVVKWYNVKASGKTSFVNCTLHLRHHLREKGVQNLDLSFFNPPDINMDKVPVDKGDWDRLLHGSVMRAFFHLRPAKKDSDEPQLRVAWEGKVAPFVDYLITGVSGTTVGWLKVPSETYDETLLGDSLCECIVISGCKAGGPRAKWIKEIYVPEWGMIEETREHDSYEFYNVLWIRWRDGIAYREGLGRVWKEGWHRQNPETRDIVLG